jgi:hypothetical protein
MPPESQKAKGKPYPEPEMRMKKPWKLGMTRE